MAINDCIETEVRSSAPMPHGYWFVPKGDVYITKNCRKRTHEEGKKLFVVVDKSNRHLGLRCPAYIAREVRADHQATAHQRAQAVQKRDTAEKGVFEAAIMRLFPHTPTDAISGIVNHALKKRSGRVGRSGKVILDEKVKLAVRAHIRHCHTDYEKLLREGVDRETARKKIWERLNEVAKQWGGRAPAKPVRTSTKPATVERKAVKGMAKSAVLQPRLEAKKRLLKSRGEKAEIVAKKITVDSSSVTKTWRGQRKRSRKGVRERADIVAEKLTMHSSPVAPTRRVTRLSSGLLGTSWKPIMIEDSDDDVFSMDEDEDGESDYSELDD